MREIKLYCWNPELNNFGDVLNPLIIEKIFNARVSQTDMISANLVGIGSTLNILLNKNRLAKYRYPILHIWSSGFIKEPKKRKGLCRRVNVCAVRGKYSKAQLEKLTGRNLEDVAIGDAGLLSSQLLFEQSEKKFNLGIIPHYVDKGDERVKSLLRLVPNSTLIDVIGNPIKTLEKIAECEIIISSAMHGLIAADSLGIPNQWIRFSDHIKGGDYKFKDYYSAYDLSPKVWDLRSKEITQQNILNIPKDYKIEREKVEDIKQSLIKAFPFKGENQS